MKSSSARAKGAQAERAAARYLSAETDFRVERGRAGAAADTGDLVGVPGFALEVKAHSDPARAIREGLADLASEQRAAGEKFGALIVRRPGRPDPAEFAVVMSLETFAAIVRELAG